LELVSENIEEIFHLDVDHARRFSGWEGNTFENGARPAVVFNRGRVERCFPGSE